MGAKYDYHCKNCGHIQAAHWGMGGGCFVEEHNKPLGYKYPDCEKSCQDYSPKNPEPQKPTLAEILKAERELSDRLAKRLETLLDCHKRNITGFPLNTELQFAIEDETKSSLQAHRERRGR